MANNSIQTFSISNPGTPPVDSQQNLPQEYHTFFNVVSNAINSLYQSGPSSNRPVSGVYVGQQYFDTTLSTIIVASAISSNGAPVWSTVGINPLT